jgi:hypothetical protein
MDTDYAPCRLISLQTNDLCGQGRGDEGQRTDDTESDKVELPSIVLITWKLILGPSAHASPSLSRERVPHEL